MSKLKFLISLPDGTESAPAESYCDVAAHAHPFPVIGFQTVIDESSVYPADLSSPFFLEEPNIRIV